MLTLSMIGIRRDAKALVERLARGECFRITYRNKTVGEFIPPARMSAVSSDDLAYRVAESAEDLGGGLDARAADALIYGT
ncbi:MAG: hypothetical protein NTW21_44275 [Verrucomicrobia bacterium]|nr:hypothetical protein [Verrucomicrobiota bacterium]